MNPRPSIFIFGLGQVGTHLGRFLISKGYSVGGTVRDLSKIKSLSQEGFKIYPFYHNMPIPQGILEKYNHIIVTIPPILSPTHVDLAYHLHVSDMINCMPQIKWVGYLSSTGVYGNHEGAWINEDSLCKPEHPRTQRRFLAENLWSTLYKEMKLPVHIFRLSGIYGYEHSVVNRILSKTIQAIDKPHHYFSRIHIDDISNMIYQSMLKPTPGEIFNLSDDEPSPSLDTIDYVCQKLNLPHFPRIPFDAAALSPTMHEFFSDNKRVSNKKIKSMLNIECIHPTYREGIDAIIDFLGLSKPKFIQGLLF
jgi:nucleoside-diphosphate-sugar epimerase